MTKIGFDLSSGSLDRGVWNNLARAVFPNTVADMIALSDHLYEKHGVYRQGIQAAVSYLVDHFEIKSFSEMNAQTRHEITRFMNQDSRLLEQASELGGEFLAYGTLFLTVHIPFDRYLVCPHCSASRKLDQVFPDLKGRLQFSKDTGKGLPGFTGPCPGSGCGLTVKFEVQDQQRDIGVDTPLKPVTIPPQIMRIIWSPASQTRIPVMEPYRYTELVEQVNAAVPEVLYDTRWEYIESIVTKKPITMAPGSMKCLVMEPSAASQPLYHGWGKPAHLSAFPYAAQLILLDTYNEVITNEYSIPRRVISPPATANALKTRNQGSGQMGLDFRNVMSPDDFKAKIRTMMSQLRDDPSQVAVSPFPLQYQLLGGESANMITRELLEYSEDRLLRSMGIPPELYKGGLNAQVATPTVYSMNLFKMKWGSTLAHLNDAFTWIAEQYKSAMQWPDFRIKTASASMTDDSQKLQILASRNSVGMLSDTTFNRALGVDGDYEDDMIKYERELKVTEMEEQQRDDSAEKMNRLLVEDIPREIENEQTAAEIEQQVAGGQGAGAPAGAPLAAGGGALPAAGGGMSGPAGQPAPGSGSRDLGLITGIPELQGISLPPGGTGSLETVPQLEGMAQSIAGRIITVPVTDRSRLTEQIKAQFPNLHMFVMKAIDQMENQGARMGIQAVREGQL